jgi:antitoxin (DNA-binding transcriptional repressor) of toxin-antitoxin stability system
MRILDIGEATAPLAEYTRDVATEPVVVTVGGKPVAALVAVDNTDLETISLGGNPEFLAIIERSRSRQQAEGGISSDAMRGRVALNE